MRVPLQSLLGLCLLFAFSNADDIADGDVTHERNADEVHAEDVPKKEVFVPAPFVTPKLSSTPHFFDYFPLGSKIGQRWIKSTAKKEGAEEDIAKYDGEWEIAAPSEVSIEGDLGLVVRTKARHHAIAAKLDKKFEFAEEPLVVQYEVTFEEGQECGGGYLKLLSEGAEENLGAFQDKTAYTIMFGPDKCGPGGKIHLIFKYKNHKNGSIDEYHAEQPNNVGSTYWDDHKTHLYTLIVHPSGAYDVQVDQRSLYNGNMLSKLHPSLTPPKMIADPEDKKPEDWDERAEIEDETAVKPEDWDESQPKEVVDTEATKPDDWLEEENSLIPDPEAKRPDDWDQEMDGEWEAPMIDNPACQGKSGCGTWTAPTKPNPLYKGKWRRPKIANPAYRGVWTARLIENPHHFEPTPFGGLAPITAVGIEMWTMSQNIVFDNVLVCGDEALAAEVAAQTYTVRKAEQARLAASKSENQGLVTSLLAATEEKPWLWVVIVLCILLPLIGIAVWCFGRKSNATPDMDAYRKKTDAIVPDDEDEEQEEVEEQEEAPLLADADGEPIEEIEMEKPGPSRRQTKKEEEQAEKAEEDEGAGDSSAHEEEAEKEEPKPSPKKSPAPTGAKKRVRRAE